MVIDNALIGSRKRPLLFLSIVFTVLILDLFSKWYAGFAFKVSESGACPYPKCSSALVSFGEPCMSVVNPARFIEDPQISKEIIPNFFYIHLMNNTGAAWSFLSGYNYLFIYFNIFFVLGAFYYMLRKNNLEMIPYICFSMIVGGAMGNFYDRIVHNSVRDFLSIIIPLPMGRSYSYPVFNGADMFICISAALYLIDQIILVKFREKNKNILSPATVIVKKNGQ